MEMAAQILRIIRAAFLYASFGLICILGCLFFAPISIFGLPKFACVRRFCRELVRVPWVFFIWLCEICGYLKKNFDARNLGRPGEIIVANHPSLLDVVFFLASVKNLNCVVKGELSKNVFLSFAIKSCGYISNSDGEAMLQACKDALNDGESLLIFPEGTRTKEQIVFRKAPFFVAIKAARILTPVVINMRPQSLKKEQSWLDVPSERIRYDFSIAKSVDLASFRSDRPDPVRVRLLQSEILEIYKEL